MMNLTRILVVLISTASAASAQDGPAALAFELGLGAETSPTFFGSSENTTGVATSFALDRLRWGSISVGEGDPYGLGVTGSVRYIPEVDTTEPLLADATFLVVDPALELGGGLTYATPGTDSFLVLRRGFGGHEGFVAELGGDIVYPVSDSMTVRVGPRLLAGDDTFVSTYFPAPAFFDPGPGPADPEGGIVSRGVEASLRYDFNDTWGITATARFDELMGDAARSPVVESTDQVSASIVVTRSFSFGF